MTYIPGGQTGGSSSSISTSYDVALSNPAGTEVLTYDASLAVWKNASLDKARLHAFTLGGISLGQEIAIPHLLGTDKVFVRAITLATGSPSSKISYRVTTTHVYVSANNSVAPKELRLLVLG